jgi:hypothetical protein
MVSRTRNLTFLIQNDMGKQHNKVEKRRRRTSYLRRKKENAKAAASRAK